MYVCTQECVPTTNGTRTCTQVAGEVDTTKGQLSSPNHVPGQRVKLSASLAGCV